MGNKLKAISKVSVALALLGAAVPSVEAAPTAMAAKKATKKAKKSTKKTVKKSTKKAKKAKKTTKKKATKKVAKKTAAKKPAKKSVKKTTKKSVKKVAKKTAAKKPVKKAVKKTVAKKPAKKVVKKPVAKKPAKKSVKKPVAKKPVKKAVKKPVAKKPAKKVVKKTTTKKPAKKIGTMADKYQPIVKSGTVNLKWGTDVTTDSDYDARKFITNDSSIPVYTSYKYLDPVNGYKGGTYTTRIQVKYPDGSMEVVGTVTFVVPVMDADKYQPTVQDVTVNYGRSIDLRNDAITNAPGYFPNDPALSQFEDDSDSTSFAFYDTISFDTYEPGTYNAQIRVEYPDGSYDITNKFKVTVLPSDADKAKVSLKSPYFTVSSKEALEHETVYGDRTLNDPTRFLNIGSALPEGTVIHFNDELDSVDTPESGKQYRTSLTLDFPDGTSYETDDFTVDVK